MIPYHPSKASRGLSLIFPTLMDVLLSDIVMNALILFADKVDINVFGTFNMVQSVSVKKSQESCPGPAYVV